MHSGATIEEKENPGLWIYKAIFPLIWPFKKKFIRDSRIEAQWRKKHSLYKQKERTFKSKATIWKLFFLRGKKLLFGDGYLWIS